MAAVNLSFGAAPIAGPPYGLVFGAVGGTVTPTANVNLVFRTARMVGPPYNLVFGAAGGEVAPEDLSLVLQATLPGLTLRASLTVLDGVTLQATALLPGLKLSGKLIYDNRVTRYLHRPARAPQQVAAPAGQAVSGAWRTSRSEQCGAAPDWRQALPVRRAVEVSHRMAVGYALAAVPGWKTAHSLALQASSLAQVADRLAQARQSAWETARAVGTCAAGQFEVADRLLHTAAALHQVASQCGYLAAGKMGRANHIETARLIPWQLARWPAVGKGVWPPVVVTPVGYVGSAHLLFQRQTLRGLPLHLVFSAYPSGRAPPPTARVVISFLRAYVTINSITLHRVSDGAPIPAFGFSMALDWQSWTWSWGASIPADKLVLVRSTSGDPVEVEAAINGVLYRLCVEDPDRQRQLAKGRVNIKGRGTAAILDAPYAPILNFGNIEARTAQQLMLDALTINGVGIGWDVDFGLMDWLVPGNAWSHQGNYISAVLDIAGAARGYVQPHATAQTLRILPKYPVAPWDWGDVVPDIELPGIATVEGIQWQRKPDYNSIHLSGIGSGGVLRQVKRAGTAGDSEAPMVTHALITHSDAARQRGLAELADTGRQAAVSLKLPVLAETGLILPGKFVRYVNGSETHIGLVRSIALDWSLPVLRQTLSVETHL